jgi:hypothetical protein
MYPFKICSKTQRSDGLDGLLSANDARQLFFGDTQLGFGTAGQEEQREQQIKTTMLHSHKRG